MNSKLQKKSSGSSTSNCIAPQFSEESTYEIDDLVLYGDNLYKFTSAHEAGEWDNTEVILVMVTDVLHNKVSKTGDTMTGTLTAPYIFAKDNIADSSASTIESNRYWGFGAKDKDDRWVNYIETSESTNGRVDASFGVRRIVNDSNVNNDFHLGVNADGTKTVSVSDPSLWRGAIGAVNKAGDTMTGGLTVQTGGIWVQGGSNAGGNNTRMGLSSGMPDAFPYNTSKRGTKIYSNAIAFADPYNGNTNNDAGWVRHIEETGNSGTLELGVGDDGNESIVARQYNTSSAIVRTLTLLDESGNTNMPGTLKFAVGAKNAIGYQGTKSYYNMIRFIDNTADTYGNGISIGGGGLTIIGGGESAENAQGAFSTGGSEQLVLCNDGAIDIWTNCQSGHASATKRTIDTSGNFNGNAANVTGTVAVAHGGTGATSAANARTNLGLTGIAVRPDYSISTTDLTAGTSNLTNNQLYFVYV